MSKILKATILMLSESPDGSPGIVGRALAKYVLGDDSDPAIETVRFKEIAAANFTNSTQTLFSSVVAAIKADEKIT